MCRRTVARPNAVVLAVTEIKVVVPGERLSVSLIESPCRPAIARC